MGILVALANLFGAITLFLLRKIAFYVFSGVLVANFLMTSWFVLSEGIAVLEAGAVFQSIIVFAVGIAICIYSWHLTKKGVLT